MAITYTLSKAVLDEIALRYKGVEDRVQHARDQLARAEADLNDMSTKYSTFISELNNKTAAEGTEPWLSLKSEKDTMVSDYNGLTTKVNDIITAFDAANT